MESDFYDHFKVTCNVFFLVPIESGYSECSKQCNISMSFITVVIVLILCFSPLQIN